MTGLRNATAQNPKVRVGARRGVAHRSARVIGSRCGWRSDQTEALAS